MSTDRRSMIAGLTGLGLAGLASRAGAQGGPTPQASQPPVEAMSRVPWPHRPLDPDTVAGQAFLTCQRGGCMLGVFEPIVRGVAAQLGSPYTALPFGMFAYGAGGVAGWGTLCGTLNGAAAAFALLSPRPSELITELMSWYESEALPDLRPAGARFPNIPVVAGSVLCHASISRWCQSSGKRAGSPERAERCAALSASVARKAVALLAAQAARTAKAPGVSPATAGCLGCHAAQGRLGNTAGRMSCAPCHTPAELAASQHPEA